MLGQDVKYEKVPFFWTTQYGKSLRYAGHALVTDEVIVHGALDAGAASAFSAYYVQGGRVAAVATFNRDPQAAAAAELLRLGLMPTPSEVTASPNLDLAAVLRDKTAVKL